MKIEDQLKDVFSDGEYHSKNEIVERTSIKNRFALTEHLVYYRKQLPRGQKLVCELVHRTIGYRQVLLLNGSTKTKKSSQG